MRTFFSTLITVLILSPFLAHAQSLPSIAFPVEGNYAFRDDFHEPRGGGTRLHQGNDIIAPKMTALLAVVDGYISYVARPQVSWGYEIEIQGDDGYTYDYLHVNNDTPGTDDGVGGEGYAYAPGIVHGARVSRGSIIGWVGDSGNAEETVSHLHFEIRDPNRNVVNPFPILSLASGGKGVNDAAPRTNVVEPSWEERKGDLRRIFAKDIAIGAESAEVRQLQLILRAMGHFTHPTATGYFGAITKTSVESYQKKKGVPVTGMIDLATRRVLNKDLGTWDPNDYIPHFSAAEERALLIQKIREQLAVLLQQLALLQAERDRLVIQ